jgi:hypothetical protein
VASGKTPKEVVVVLDTQRLSRLAQCDRSRLALLRKRSIRGCQS